RHTPHGGQDQDAPRLWVEYSNPARQTDRDRDNAPLVGQPLESSIFAPERPREPPRKPPEEMTFEDFFGPDDKT
ncbi:MAG TPA: hypothetical protein VIO35_03420, partial [Chloroflexota bacterium]